MARWRRPRGSRRVRGRRRRWRRWPGLPRARSRLWTRCRRCWARQAICSTCVGLARLAVGERRRRSRACAGSARRPRRAAGGRSAEPVLVIAPCGSASPDWSSDGVRPEPGEQLAAAARSGPVAAELEVQRQRGQRVDAAEAAQARDGRPQPGSCASRESRSSSASRRAIRPSTAASMSTNASSVGWLLEALARRASARCARFHVVAPRIDAAVPQQQLRDAMAQRARSRRAPARGRERDPPASIRQPAGTAHRLQLAGQQQPRQQLGVLAVGLDPITAPPAASCSARPPRISTPAAVAARGSPNPVGPAS